MTKNGHIYHGYKTTSLGIFPQEWEVKQIRDIAKVVTGSTPPTNDDTYWGSEYLFVTPTDIGDAKYITDTERKLSLKGFSASRKLPQGSILFTCIGSTIGKMGIAPIDLTSNQQINAIICNEINIEFLFYRLLYQRNRIRLLAGEQAVPIINKSAFEKIQLVIPPIEEQKKIVAILSEWDKAIELQTKLIEKQELRKRALMQRLLTGRVRLNGHCGIWRKVKLNNFCERVIRRNSSNNKNVMTISAQKGFVNQTDFFSKTIASENLDNYIFVKKDEFCYNKSYSNGYPMGVIKRLQEVNEAVVTTLYICFKLKKMQT
ncbi:MAG: restriction endonuclease subunit S [Prevotellaceae bacterium]|nr:restriction endonuclease subunit S [Prevotellaceae bacterium]